MNELLKLLSGLLGKKVAFDGEDGWITMNGTAVKVDDKGKPVVGPSNVTGQGQKHAPAKSVEEKRTAVRGAMQKIANGSQEETVPGLRDDLEQFGGTNDVTIVRGDKKKGLEHIAERRGADVISEVLEAVIDGKIDRFVPTKKTVHVQKDGYEAVLSLDEHGKKKTWLLTGYDIQPAKDSKGKLSDESGKVSTRLASTQTGPTFSRSGLGADSSFTKIITQIFPKANVRILGGDRIAFDRASQRHFDENGFLHVAMTPISKEQVADYYGSEIPGWQKLGLDPNRIYKGYRPASELAKAAATFNGLPLLKEHVKISAEDLKEELRAGNLGTAAKFVAPYLYNALIIQDAESIEGLNPKDGQPAKCELSSSYRYDPVFKPGVFQGQRYDFVMTNIRGNHVALVEEGRAGPDVVVADAKPITPRGNTMDLKALLEQLLSALSGGAKTPPPGNDEDTPPAEEFPADDEGTEETASDDFAERLSAHVSGMEDQVLAAKLAEVIEAVKAAGLSADEDPDAAEDEDEPAKEEPGEKEKDKPAMDRRPGKRPASRAPVAPAKKSGKGSPVTINLAMDANAVAAKIHAGFKAQIEAARDVRPLIGDVDPLAFDSAAQIYGRALNLIGKPSKLTDSKALKELCALAADAKRGKSVYPVVSSVLANDSKGDADPAFANLGNIRKA